MQNNFVPIHLRKANAKLDTHSLAPVKDKINVYRKKELSLLEKFLKLFKR